ncbi:XRE family transcriptional regulator [Tenacibaculum singaporense]|uniref:XRE family transcriptional regulator n=2 Tax=Flavobacteriaceae TaxID=49546 RepID=A0A3S8R4C7_9FLAO|nr:helix-turn-helix transcriptional regulator [Tenacibaculum singaporense]AZJ34617.1 XRE family transcriptional regulator [Tenacibaculum singaporense]RSC95105.1 XRE family transcriptional regulator [Tenacibaculum singaporense]
MTSMSLYISYVFKILYRKRIMLSKNEVTLKKVALCVKTLREEYHITSSEFYIDTGIHLARIEQGKTNVTITTLQKICDYFNITLSDFFMMLEEI